MMRPLAKKLILIFLLLVVGVAMTGAASGKRQKDINVLLNQPVTNALLAELNQYGRVQDVIVEINAVFMRAPEKSLADIQGLGFVEAAVPDAFRQAGRVNNVSATDFSDGLSTWNLDAVNVTDFGFERTVDFDGDGVYVAVLDTGLLRTWPQIFPSERIGVDYAKSFDNGSPKKWGQALNSHGTHVTSTILGFVAGGHINGVAPRATIIPVKVLDKNGGGTSSVVAKGIMHVANLKAGPLAGSPIVINMSLGGPSEDPVENAAIDYAIDVGILVVAAAGNEGDAGMHYPGAYAPVISVAASGWVGEWENNTWWTAGDVDNSNGADNFYITEFSSREKAGQQLDVAAPGSWIMGPDRRKGLDFLSGTSSASAHVAGTLALMAQKNPGLIATDAEAYLKNSAVPLGADCRAISGPDGVVSSICWGADASGAGMMLADEALALVP